MNQFIALLADSEWLVFFSNPIALLAVVPFLALAVFGIVGGIATMNKQNLRHRERMAMIERGMHPDHPPEPGEPQNQE